MQVTLKHIARDYRFDYDDFSKFAKKYHSKFGVREENGLLLTSTLWSDDLIKSYQQYKKELKESLKAEYLGQQDMSEEAQESGQPHNNFYVPSVMTQKDVITNILQKFSKNGITHSFQGNDLIITAGTVDSKPQEQILDDLTISIKEVIKFLKDEYKGITGKILNIGKEESTNFDVVGNYTTNRSALVRLTHIYDLPDSTAEADTSSEKAEIRGNIPVLNQRVK